MPSWQTLQWSVFLGVGRNISQRGRIKGEPQGAKAESQSPGESLPSAGWCARQIPSACFYFSPVREHGGGAECLKGHDFERMRK